MNRRLAQFRVDMSARGGQAVPIAAQQGLAMQARLIIVALLLVAAAPAAAKGARWIATSTTSMAITGNITVTADSITFGNGKTIRIKPVSADRPEVFTIDPPSNPVLLQRNRLCGDQPPTFITLYREDGSLTVSVFDGPDMPQSPTSTVQLQPGICATYHYER
jgi:hypothetical protein